MVISMPLFFISASLFILENIKVKETKQHKGMPISTTDTELGAAGVSVQLWNAWSWASKTWSPLGISLGLTKGRRKGMWSFCPYYSP